MVVAAAVYHTNICICLCLPSSSISIRLFSFHTPINLYTQVNTHLYIYIYFSDNFNISMKLKLGGWRLCLCRNLWEIASAIKGYSFGAHNRIYLKHPWWPSCSSTHKKYEINVHKKAMKKKRKSVWKRAKRDVDWNLDVWGDSKFPLPFFMVWYECTLKMYMFSAHKCIMLP